MSELRRWVDSSDLVKSGGNAVERFSMTNLPHICREQGRMSANLHIIRAWSYNKPEVVLTTTSPTIAVDTNPVSGSTTPSPGMKTISPSCSVPVQSNRVTNKSSEDCCARGPYLVAGNHHRNEQQEGASQAPLLG